MQKTRHDTYNFFKKQDLTLITSGDHSVGGGLQLPPCDEH